MTIIIQTKELDTDITVIRGRVCGVLLRKDARQHRVFVCKVGYYRSNLMRPLCGSAPKFHVHNGWAKKRYPKNFENVVTVYDRFMCVSVYISVYETELDSI